MSIPTFRVGLIRRGPSTINLSAGTGRNRQLEEGDDTSRIVTTGELIEHRRKHNSYFNKDPFVAASWALERGVRQGVPPQRPLAAEQLRPVPEQPRHAAVARRTTTI